MADVIINQIPVDTFESLAKGAGMVLTQFDTTLATPFDQSHLLATTTGGVNIFLKPITKDHAEGIDNAKEGMLELQEVTMYDAGMKFTTKTIKKETLSFALGFAGEEVVSGDSVKSGTKIVPKHGMLSKSNVKEIWYVVPQTPTKVFSAVLKNAFSMDGLNFQSQNDGTGNLEISLKGMYSITAQDESPLECYVIEKQGE